MGKKIKWIEEDEVVITKVELIDPGEEIEGVAQFRDMKATDSSGGIVVTYDKVTGKILRVLSEEESARILETLEEADSAGGEG